ncbi:hypothetical protein G9A89_018509 [Geosiphon pyriformis]|nr:hypothetical protein G9A89_018509 [Geosiphon pyriformis]
MREVKKIFPKFDLSINQADGLGVRNSSNKAVIFIEVSGGPENIDSKHVNKDSEKLLKEAVFGLYILVSELEIQTGVINKLRLSKSVDGIIVPKIRDWIWLPDHENVKKSKIKIHRLFLFN